MQKYCFEEQNDLSVILITFLPLIYFRILHIILIYDEVSSGVFIPSFPSLIMEKYVAFKIVMLPYV